MPRLFHCDGVEHDTDSRMVEILRLFAPPQLDDMRHSAKSVQGAAGVASMKAWYTAFSNGIATLVAFVGIGMMLVTGAKYPRLWQWAAAIFWAKLPLSVASAPRSSFLTKTLLIAAALLDLAVVGFCFYQAYASRDLPTANVLIAALALVALLVFARGVMGLIMAMVPSAGAADKFDAEWSDQQ